MIDCERHMFSVREIHPTDSRNVSLNLAAIPIPCRTNEYALWLGCFESHMLVHEAVTKMGIIYFYSCGRQLNAKHQNQIQQLLQNPSVFAHCHVHIQQTQKATLS